MVSTDILKKIKKQRLGCGSNLNLEISKFDKCFFENFKL